MALTALTDEVRLPDGRAAQLRQGGDPAGTPVLFFHGTPDSRLAARSGDAAARGVGVRLVAVNRPGYGRSDPDDSDHLSVADDTVAVADALGIGTFAVLGMSVGGQYALACAARHPDRVTTGCVVATPAEAPSLAPPLPRDGLDEDGQTFFARLSAGSVEDNVTMLRPDFAAYVAGMAVEDADDDALVARLLRGLHELDRPLVAALPVHETATSVREALARPDGYLRDAAVAFRGWDFSPADVRCPTWLWYGVHDPQAAVRNGVWLSERIPDATLVIREDTAHLGTLLQHWPGILATLAQPWSGTSRGGVPT